MLTTQELLSTRKMSQLLRSKALDANPPFIWVREPFPMRLSVPDYPRIMWGIENGFGEPGYGPWLPPGQSLQEVADFMQRVGMRSAGSRELDAHLAFIHSLDMPTAQLFQLILLRRNVRGISDPFDPIDALVLMVAGNRDYQSLMFSRGLRFRQNFLELKTVLECQKAFDTLRESPELTHEYMEHSSIYCPTRSALDYGELIDIIPKLRVRKDSLVVDLGCGYGDSLIELARELDYQFVGVDRQEFGILSMAQNADLPPNLSFETKDLLTVNFDPQNPAVIITAGVWGHLDANYSAAFVRRMLMTRSLANKGYLIVAPVEGGEWGNYMCPIAIFQKDGKHFVEVLP